MYRRDLKETYRDEEKIWNLCLQAFKKIFIYEENMEKITSTMWKLLDHFVTFCEEHLYHHVDMLQLAPDQFFDLLLNEKMPFNFVQEIKKILRSTKKTIQVGDSFNVRVSKLKIRDIRNINTREDSFGCQFVLRLHWVDRDLKKFDYKKLDNLPPDLTSNPRVYIKNAISFETDEPKMTAEFNDNDTTYQGRVRYTVAFTATLGSNFDLHHYPFDAHVLEITLDSLFPNEVQLFSEKGDKVEIDNDVIYHRDFII
eukprot:UN06654